MAINGVKILKRFRICSICGKRIWDQGYDPDSHISHIMTRDKTCFECAYWKDLIDYPPKYLEVLGSQCLRLHPVADKKNKALLLGGRGKMRCFMRNDGSLLQSNDVWIIGNIPEHFRYALPSTVSEISVRAYNQLKKSTKKCKARACMDRYRCYRYDLDIEKDSGPFNTIPPKWNVGDEHCSFFIDIKDFKVDESSVSKRMKENEAEDK